MRKRLWIKGSSASKEPLLVELEDAKLWDYNDTSNQVVIENRLVRSYEELCTVASQEDNKDKEVLEAYFVHFASGG